MNHLFQALEAQLNARSRREKILLFLTLALGIYFCIFHAPLLDSLNQITQLKENIKQNQFYLQSNKTQDIAKELSKAQQLHNKLTALIQTFNSQSLPIFATLKKINDYALSHQIALWQIDTEDENANYQISLMGNSSLQDSLSFLNFVENLPLIHILSFEILENGDFKLAIKNHQILSALPPDDSLSPDFVLQHIRQAIQKEDLIFSNQSPNQAQAPTQATLELEALFNQKAKINGLWLKEGERIEGYRLEAIQSNQVILKSEDATLKLQLKKQIF